MVSGAPWRGGRPCFPEVDRARASLYKPPAFNRPIRRKSAQVAQLVEQRTENPRVGGSIPSLATIISNKSGHLDEMPFLV